MIFRENSIFALYVQCSWFAYGSSLQVELEFGNVGLLGGRKTGGPRGKYKDQGNNQQQTQPTYSARLELKLSHIGGERSLLPLCHPCSSDPIGLVKRLHESHVAHQSDRAFPNLCSMKQLHVLGIFLLPPDGMLVHHRVTSQR